MGNQRLIQTQTATNDQKQYLDKRTKQPEHPMQEVLGSRAASRYFRTQLQRPPAEGASVPNPLHSILQSISFVSPRAIQAKPMFRGLSHELTSALDSRGMVIQAKMTLGAPGDKYEQEADRVAEQVVQKMHAPSAPESMLGEPLQPQQGEEDGQALRMKPLAQRPAVGGMAATQDLESSIHRARGGGQPLEAGLQRKLGQAMGADFSGVRVHTGHQADQLNRSIQAKAFTTGQDVFFRQGEYNPESSAGQKVLAHELTHVVQQQSGRVSRKKQIKEQVSDGGQVHGSSLSIQPSDGSNLVVQRDYVTPPYYGFGDLNKTFPGSAYQKLKNAIVKYRQSKQDQAALNLMVGAMNELQSLPSEVYKEYEILSKEVQTEQSRISGVSPLPVPSLPTSKPEVKPTVPTSIKPEVKPTVPTSIKPEVKPTVPTSIKPEVKPTIPTSIKPEVKPTVPTSITPEKKPTTPTLVTPEKKPTTPTLVTPEKKPSTPTWATAELRPDPKVLDKHQLKSTRLLPEGKTFYEFGSSERWEAPKGGWAVEDLVPEDRSTVLLKQGEVPLSPVGFSQRKLSDLSKEKLDTSTYTISKETKVEFASDTLVQLNGKAGRIIIFSTQKQGNHHWVSQDYIERQEQKGYRFKYSDTTYWATQDSFTTEQVGGTYVDKTNIPLWTKQSPPSIEHIKQGSLGDCYLLATLASIMLKDPGFPTKMMQDNPDGTVTVKLFDVQKASTPSGFTAGEKYVKVNKSVPEEKGEALYAQEHLWVQMIEKAYAAGGFTGNLLKTPSSTSEPQYKDIGSGNEQHAFRVLLGQDATYKGLSKVTDDEQKKNALFLQIETALEDKQPITLGTKKFGDLPTHKQSKATKGAGLAGEDILENVVLQHAYSVIRTEADQFSRYLIVRNPWGGGGGETVRKGSQEKEDKKGEIRISLGNLTSYFSNITIGPRTVSL
jgi:Domain of unknown function (DUF4157)/Calpain family cysteine protease